MRRDLVSIVHLPHRQCPLLALLPPASYSQHFPTSSRTSAMGVLAGSGRLGSIAGQIVFSALVHVSIPALLSVAAGLLLLGAAAAAALPQVCIMDEEQASTATSAPEGETRAAARYEEAVPLASEVGQVQDEEL